MARTTMTRLPELGSSDRALLNALLDESRIGHIGLMADGHPVVIPTAIARDGDLVLAHGSTGSRWMRSLAGGAAACLAVTELGGLVVARSAFESSMHYRSAVLFGTFTPVTGGEAKLRALDILTEALLTGRVAEVRRPSTKELAATLVLALPISEWSLKVSDGWSEDPDEDIAGEAWAGIVPFRLATGPAVNNPDLRPGIAVPRSVRQLD